MEEEGRQSILLLGYCFSTGNSVVKRALKAMTLVIWVFYTLITVNANRIPRPPVLTWHSFTKENRERFRDGKKKSREPALADGDHQVCVFHAIEVVFQENTISQVCHFPFENMCLRCMLLSEKGGVNLLLLTENPNRDLPSFINFLWNVLCLPHQ